MRNRFLFSFVLLTSRLLAGDTLDYYNSNTLRYDDHVYVKNIASVQLSPDPDQLIPAIIKLGSTDKLYLSFDDFDADNKDYYFSFVHCTSDWQPSNIMQSEYLDGFSSNPIHDYRFSRATIQRYNHYSASFPGDGISILKSGNYLLKVFLDNDEDKLVITRRFMVTESMMSVEMNVHAATIVADRNFKQEVDFKINYPTDEVGNPYAQITPVILQNYNWSNPITGLQPQFVNNGQLVYDYDDVNVFRGGSEFRYFDTRSLRLQSERVQSIQKDSLNNYHVWLLPDERRSYKRYVNSNDINGKFLIKTNDGGSSDVDAEYCYVHFFLPWDPPATEGNMYVFGALTDWQCKPEAKLTYNYALKGYEATLYLKQGYYNYEYVLQRDNSVVPDEQFAEGMHQETENDYTVIVYYRKQGSWVDQIVAIQTMNSRNF
ncbi:MAG TPA: DUF5103 domain-containing protein [Bacteroidia bacterium]|jgi:hypothetical protein|nr:DUF5103 domain-containing protein [Bacteroidia bacterium]